MLPIFSAKEEIVASVKANQVTVVVGATGSGKTTQLPVFIYEAGIAGKGVIGITQPRRIAAVSVAKFVAKQLDSKLGDLVGYKIRFDDETDSYTDIKFMTDGILLREIQSDRDLSRYSVLVIDEAHERSVNIDFLLGLVKDVLKKRKDLKVVVASATIDSAKFSSYFGNAPIVNVPGQTYPVEIVWRDEDVPEFKMIEGVADTVVGIHLRREPGDILAFMTGESEIRGVIESIAERKLDGLVLLPVYSGLSPDEQQKIFNRYEGKRKVIVATNIAETSITVDGVVHVVDSGLIKQRNFNPESGIESLDVVEHSQAGCEQRAGRAGRTQPGVCYRMYSRDGFAERSEFTKPEIHRMSLAGVVLNMESLGISDIENFDFVEPPDQEAFHEAYETLIALGAIERDKPGLTGIGKAMARLPLDPKIARMVLEAEKFGCVYEVAIVAALLSVRNITVRPQGKEKEADLAHQKFRDSKSDILTFLNIWEEYEESGNDREWCRKNFLSSRALWEVGSIFDQLSRILEYHDIELTEAKSDDHILRCIAVGFAYNLMEKQRRFTYAGKMRPWTDIFIHPGSAVFGQNPKWMVAVEAVRTSKLYARIITEVRPEWLPEVAPAFYRFGQVNLKDYKLGDDVALAVQDVMAKGELGERSTGERVFKMPLAEAKSLYRAKLEEAKQKSWLKLTFWTDRWHKAAEHNGQQYEIAMFSKLQVEDGRTYYCSQASRYDGLYPRSVVEVRPEFPVLELGEPEPSQTFSNSAAEQLRSAWKMK